MPERIGELRHIGFENDDTQGFSSSVDVNGIEWELFSEKDQDEKIEQIYGVPVSKS